MTIKLAAGLPFFASLLLLSACGSSKDAAVAPSAPAPNNGPAQPQAMQPPPQREMQPLQPGQPPQQQPKSALKPNPVQGGNPGTTPLAFSQPFKLGDLEYNFEAARGKDFVGLEANPAMKPAPGNMYFLVRYLVCNDGGRPICIPNNSTVHLMTMATKQVSDIDQAATNANIQSGASPGLPDQMTLQPGAPNLQTLAFQLPSSTDASGLALLVTDPADPTHVFQIVKLSN